MSTVNMIEDRRHCSSAHKSIRHCIGMLAPFKSVKISQEIPFSQDDIFFGEEQFYEFIKNLYLKMYEDPEKFQVPTAPYDEYMKTARLKKGIEKAHYTDGRECNLRNTFQQAIQFYARFFYELGLKAEEIRESDYALVISKLKLDEVYASLEVTHLRKENPYRYEVLKDFGIEIRQADDFCFITSRYYPRMFIGLWVLCAVPESKYKYMNYLRLDYRGYYRSCPEIEDIIKTLDKNHGEIISEIQEILLDLKLKVKVKPLRNITSGSRWKVEYSGKGKSVFGFYADQGNLMLCIYFNSAQNISELCRVLEESEPVLFHWLSSKFPERLCACPNNRRITLGEEKRRICGLSNRAEITNPDEADVKNSIKVMKLFRNL
ncbi:MAG: hypothetical protein Q8930_09140 [Bacillota bacterium]|nr:hypothetical protein [Bacillota bacterium]